jgi:hypothetical protein
VHAAASAAAGVCTVAERSVAARSSVVCNNAHPCAVARIIGTGVVVGARRAGIVELTGRRTTVAICHVAVVALLAGIEHGVAAGGEEVDRTRILGSRIDARRSNQHGGSQNRQRIAEPMVDADGTSAFGGLHCIEQGAGGRVE